MPPLQALETDQAQMSATLGVANIVESAQRTGGEFNTYVA